MHLEHSIATMASSSNDGTEQPVSTLSEYEQARARNIEKNNARLRSLGLISVAEEKQSNDNAWGRHSCTNNASDDDDDDDDSSSDEEYSEGNTSSLKKRRKKKNPLPPREGSRKSRRLMHLPSEDGYADGTPPNETAQERKARIQKEREDLVAECREARQRAAIEVAKAGLDVAGQKNPTATYEHCLMRVRTMNEKGLTNRVS